MAGLTVQINTNWLGRAFGLNTVSSTDVGKSPRYAKLDHALNWLCDIRDRATAIEALDVLESADDKTVSDIEVAKAYFKLKGLVTETCRANFSENLTSGHLRITGLDSKKPAEFFVSPAELQKVLLLPDWEKIADRFDNVHKDAAQSAFERLVLADTVEQQLSAYAELHQYVRPESRGALTWQIPAKGVPAFRLGTVGIPCCTEIAGLAEDLDLESTCHLLCSLHYDGKQVVTEFHDFGTEGVTERDAKSVLQSEIRFLRRTPMLSGVLALLRLHQHDDNDAVKLRREVEWITDSMYEGDGDRDYFALRCGQSAENLRIGLKEVLNSNFQTEISKLMVERGEA